MFRRKEESLFDNELIEETESFAVVQPQAASSAPIVVPTVPAAAAPVVPAAPVQTTVAAPAATAQPITRPASVPPVSNAYRPSMPVSSAAPAAPSIPRSTEVKPMISSSVQSNKANNRVLTVGNDILLKGEITTCDRLVIEGKVEATISDVNTVELAECGSFKGSANVVDAQISGIFEGDLIVTGRLVIYASGKVRGNVSYGEIEIERGGELSGTIKAAGSIANSALPKALRKEAA